MFSIGFILFMLHITLIHGHGYLADPLARSSAWLFDQSFADCCTYHDHLQMSCGGMHRQWSVNGGKCSICGEAADLKSHQFGVGDPKYLGKIVRTYNQGATIPVTVVLTANHLGSFEFRVCNIDGESGKDATQTCLDLNVLEVGNGSRQYPVKSTDMNVYLNVTLPANLTCQHCVFQWKYKTGNSWGVSNTGRACLGCGEKNEEFYGCSDIAIVNVSMTENITVLPKQNVPSRTLYRNCTSKVVFSQQYDLTGIMEQYCQKICSNRCVMDRIEGGDKRYQGCVKSCDVLCTCQ